MYHVIPSAIFLRNDVLSKKSKEECELLYVKLLDDMIDNVKTQTVPLFFDCCAETLIAFNSIIPNYIFQRQIKDLIYQFCSRGKIYEENPYDGIKKIKSEKFLDASQNRLLTTALDLYSPTKKIAYNNNKKYNFMKTEQYSIKRDELLSLISQILLVKELSDEEREKFISTQKKLQENQFKMVLIGEFQGGKSTTFNAICGGRELAPRGARTKTSAISLTATNLADAETKEFAIVRWKTDAELVKTISDVVKWIPRQEICEDEEAQKKSTVYDLFDFNNPKHMDALRKEVESVLHNVSEESDVNENLLEQYRIAYLIVEFYNNETIQSYKKQTNYSIGDISRFSIWPEKWESRNNFKPEEVLFAFVGEINLHIHSEDLRRLGCSITDCPGLFASSWDTSIAFKALSDADAVLYLLGGEKSMKDGDKKAVSKIKTYKTLQNKLFFSV